MKTAAVVVALTLSTLLTLLADDTAWRQPGVRVWYIGATASYSGQTDAEEANLIQSAGGATLRVVRHSSVAFWDAPLPVSVLPGPNPSNEGPFWISPARLRALHPPDAFSWQGLSLVVKARVTYQHADDLPFFAYLPVQALYAAKSPRELITLTGDNDGIVGDYFFDVETGLGLSSTLASPGFYMMMMLSEINYDFATHQAFAEDNGAHTGYRASQMAGRQAWPISQFFLFEERVVSRYRQSIRSDLTLSLQNIASGQSFQGDYTSWFDGDTRQFWTTPIGVTMAAASTLTTNGTHGFFWVPASDLARDTIRVWDLDLAGGDLGVFATTQAPGDWGFTRLGFDADGFVQEMTVQSPAMSFDVDSRTATAGSTTNYVTGRAYYLQSMSNAIPGEVSQRDLGIMKMKVPKKITYTGSPVTKTVSITLQNHGTQSETITNGMLHLEVISLGACLNPVASVLSPQLPVTLSPKAKLTVVFAVPYGCANDPLASTKTTTHWDYRYVAGVVTDADVHDDACPHDAPPGGVDPVNSKVKDKGCGGKKPNKTLGADLFTDIVVK